MSFMTQSATSPVQQRDIRSAARGFKRDKDHAAKWSQGAYDPLESRESQWGTILGDEREELSQLDRIKPVKIWYEPRRRSSDNVKSQPAVCSQGTNRKPFVKSHSNKTPKPFANSNMPRSYSNVHTGRLSRKNNAVIDSKEHTGPNLSRSILEDLPQHINNTDPAIHTVILNSPADASILYSFDAKGPTPSTSGRSVDLGGLVDQAEKKWVSEQTDKIVAGEYEVLDQEGETTKMNTKGRGKRASFNKQKTKPVVVQTAPAPDENAPDEDDFELI